MLYDPNEKTAPSSPDSIKHFARIAEKMSVDVERITKRQLAELAEFDGLFIRETTSIDNHTYRFARRAWQEGMPVIDDPISMIRCTNKVFLMELLQQNQVPTPPTVIVAEDTDLTKVIDELGLPLVVKIPDGSFSRGVHKVESAAEFKRICDELFEETDLLLAQKFLPTDFDWRVGVLAGEPLFVCQYRMARGHWQVVKYRPDGSSHEGGFRAFGLDQAPREVIDIAVRAARPIGDGFYGVDLKQTDHGIVVMEVNDNPSLEHGIEDTVGKDEIWMRLLALVHRPLRAVDVIPGAQREPGIDARLTVRSLLLASALRHLIERPAGARREIERIGQAERQPLGAGPGDHGAVVGA